MGMRGGMGMDGSMGGPMGPMNGWHAGHAWSDVCAGTW